MYFKASTLVKHDLYIDLGAFCIQKLRQKRTELRKPKELEEHDKNQSSGENLLSKDFPQVFFFVFAETLYSRTLC